MKTNQKSRGRPRPDDRAQSKLFIEKAREIEADEKRSHADELLGQLAKKPPEPRSKQKSAKDGDD